MKFLLLATAALPLVLPAKEIVLYDVDFTRPETYAPDPIPTGQGAYPGRSQASSISFGSAVHDEAPPGFSPETFACAILRSIAPGNLAAVNFNLFAGGVYVFRKHRIELTFQFVDSGALAANEGFTIFTDFGVTQSLNFDGSGNVRLRSFVPRVPPNPNWSNNTVSESTPAGTFDPAMPVHVIWETDIGQARTTVTVNGVAVMKSGLSEVFAGTRNWSAFRGPTEIRLSHQDTAADGPLAIRSVRITGDDHDGPQYESGGGPNPLFYETGVMTVPFKLPPTGTWQPEFSEDGSAWKTFGGVVNSNQPITSVSFGTLLSPRMFFRLVEVP
jgi:hypothetical protein